ncbi:zinc-binding alcohol dehydrogenase [Alteromonas sp. MB-3u-76]|jgi:putative PIG3 family NAD(P)H quinone oxidoreductase|uniref:NAD(P)H-quinone oxidoreductase n=1 Tax=unclassified Alteromonas TaxID=2614992 RepID=UPI0009039B29|nr:MULTISPECIES: NAD(P)H-quinone oxidoreductase [unclassified Alteromonas]APE05446.1 zinc-binding alcohol dehydrogenase [Alteromonas sp. RW2A1]AUC88777.1 zinc-binding alcohol dehydrogenase [Alteromonas sp. MB-3u-76]
MYYVDFEKGCSPTELNVKERASYVLPNGMVKVEVSAFGINRADTLQRQGHYPPPPGESAILGLEVAGTVVEVAPDVSNFKQGDRVFGLVAGGGYATEAIVNPAHLMPIPENMPFFEAAGLAEVFLTAFQCLRTIAHVKPAQRALIHGGASGVGLAATQLCRYWGVHAAVTASSSQKLSLCEQNGAEQLVNYKTQSFVDELKAVWPDGVDMVLDMVGGDYLNKNLSVLKQDGIIVNLAMLAGRYADKLDMALLLGKRATLTGTTLRNRSDDYKAKLISDFSTVCLPAFATGELKVNIDTHYKIDDIDKPHARLENNDTKGKLTVSW